ncbi:unnamed protein product [Gordionus sp. m RMFG-2023]|uniref:neuroglian-like n=1 Tax=Gordionus sp. m RMFG-2023 TaxID=3053472 RepID=UPI0030E1242E
MEAIERIRHRPSLNTRNIDGKTPKTLNAPRGALNPVITLKSEKNDCKDGPLRSADHPTKRRFPAKPSVHRQITKFVSPLHLFNRISPCLILTVILFIRTSKYTVLCQQPKPEDAVHEPLIISEPPTNVKLEECSGRSASIRWDPPLKTDVLRYDILGHLLGTPDGSLEKLGEALAPSTEFRTDLKPGSNYTFKVATINREEFISNPSEATEVCSTPGDTPEHNPLNVVGKGSDPSNMVITWDAVNREAWNGPGFHYKVEYKPKDQSEWQSHVIENPEETSYTVKDIPAFTAYDIKVTALNSHGVAKGPANVVTGFSGEDIPTAKPENVQLVEIINGSRARISWTPVADNDVKGQNAGYKIRSYTTLFDGTDNITEVKVPPRTDNAIIDILRPNTENIVKVAVFNNKFDGPESEEIVINTPEAVPGKPNKFKGLALGPDAIRLTWAKPKSPNGKIIGYRVMYAPEDEVGNALAPEVEAGPIRDLTQQEVFLIGLNPDTKYKSTIRAATSAGYGEPAIVVTKTTRPGAPDKPQFDVNIVDDGFNISQKETGNPGAFFYLIYRKEGGKWFSTPTAEHWKMIKNVSENTNYEIQMISINGNHSSVSEPQKFMVPLDRPPNTPFNVHLDRCDTKETKIVWDVKPVEKSPVTNFIIEHQEEGNDDWKELEGKHPASAEEFVITDLPEGRHRFRVISANRKGRSNPSDPTPICEITKQAQTGPGEGGHVKDVSKTGIKSGTNSVNVHCTAVLLACSIASLSAIRNYVL